MKHQVDTVVPRVGNVFYGSLQRERRAAGILVADAVKRAERGGTGGLVHSEEGGTIQMRYLRPTRIVSDEPTRACKESFPNQVLGKPAVKPNRWRLSALPDRKLSCHQRATAIRADAKHTP